MPYVQDTLSKLQKSSPGEFEFYQAVEEVLNSLRPLLDRDKKYTKHNIIERLVEPERQVSFRVTWLDDSGVVQVNKAYRIQYNSAIGPYKGGMRFHPSVYSGIIKFLGFEQVFKNALTGLPIGGSKGGSDFNPKNKSDLEIMRFCQSLMNELYRYIGPTTDVPAGDIGVRAREIGYMFGQYKRLTGNFDGVLTGKKVNWGGSLARTEATGYGVAYFAQNMLHARGQSLAGKICAVSGAGNVAIHTIEKLYLLGAKPVTCSDSRGMVYHAAGIDLPLLKQLKEVEAASLEKYLAVHPQAVYTPVSQYPEGRNHVWSVPCDAAFPCATQNELNKADALVLLGNGCTCICEGANMPSTPQAIEVILQANIAYGPGKAANAGGVSVSQLEMAQNASMQVWTFEQVDQKLQAIMDGIYTRVSETAKEFDQSANLVLGANIAGFRRVADAMIDQGVV